MKKYLQYAKAYVLSQNFAYDEDYFNSIDVEAQFIAASTLIANLSMNECPFVLMILISFFNTGNDLHFEDPYMITRFISKNFSAFTIILLLDSLVEGNMTTPDSKHFLVFLTW